MKNPVRFYPPMTPGELEDFLTELEDAGAHVDRSNPAAGAQPTHIQWNSALYALADDEDNMRIQLLDAHDPTSAWSQIERMHEPWMSHVHGDAGDEVGADDTKSYGPYTKPQADAMLAKIKSQGMTITGENPWHVDTGTHGVKFDATYDGSNITIKITGANFYVSNAKVWDKLDPVMQAAKNISGDTTAAPATKAAADAQGAKSPSLSLDRQEQSSIGIGTLLIGLVVVALIFKK